MKKNEKTYVIIFDKHANFKEIYVLNKSSDPFVVNPKSVGDQIYIYNQKEFKKIIESAMRYLTTPVGVDEDAEFVNVGQQVTLPNSTVGYIKDENELSLGDGLRVDDIDNYNKYIIQNDSRIINNTNKVTKGTTVTVTDDIINKR